MSSEYDFSSRTDAVPEQALISALNAFSCLRCGSTKMFKNARVRLSPDLARVEVFSLGKANICADCGHIVYEMER